MSNLFAQAFPEAGEAQFLSCEFEVKAQAWPVVSGEYHVLVDGLPRPVAVSTLASSELAGTLARRKPRGLCLVGKTETENIGIDKIVKNTIANPDLQFLLLVGQDPQGHHSGRTLLALFENGVDKKGKVVGTPGKHPVLRNVSREEVEAFRKQVQVVDLAGCEDVDEIVATIEALADKAASTCTCGEGEGRPRLTPVSTVPVIAAKEPGKIELDKAGYFVIVPQPEKGLIVMEHYAYDHRLLHAIEGHEARSLYTTIVENGWVSLLSHAAYLGKELARAELSLQLGFKYVQDGA